MIAFNLASPRFGTSFLQLLQQFATSTQSAVRKCCLLLSEGSTGFPVSGVRLA